MTVPERVVLTWQSLFGVFSGAQGRRPGSEIDQWKPIRRLRSQTNVQITLADFKDRLPRIKSGFNKSFDILIQTKPCQRELKIAHDGRYALVLVVNDNNELDDDAIKCGGLFSRTN